MSTKIIIKIRDTYGVLAKSAPIDTGGQTPTSFATNLVNSWVANGLVVFTQGDGNIFVALPSILSRYSVECQKVA
jgi:hypothetical protein